MKLSKKSLMWEGYMTVEAALVMVLVLYVCISVIYLGFFQYDRCLMRQDAYRAALCGSSIYKDDNYQVYNISYQTMRKLIGEKYVGTKVNYTITAKDTVKVCISGGVRMPFRGIMGFLGTVEWQLLETAESRCINPVTFIRFCRDIQMKRRKEC